MSISSLAEVLMIVLSGIILTVCIVAFAISMVLFAGLMISIISFTLFTQYLICSTFYGVKHEAF